MEQIVYIAVIIVVFVLAVKILKGIIKFVFSVGLALFIIYFACRMANIALPF